MKRAVERDIEDLAPLGVTHFGERFFPPQRSIVDQDIDAAEMLHRCIRHRLHRCGVGHVADMDQRLAAGSFDLARDGPGLGTVAARIDHQRRTALRQRQRDGAADITPRAGDDGYFSREFVVAGHVPYPRNDERSIRPLWSVASSFNAASLCCLLQPPCSALSKNLSVTSCRVSGSCAPPPRYGCRASRYRA